MIVMVVTRMRMRTVILRCGVFHVQKSVQDVF